MENLSEVEIAREKERKGTLGLEFRIIESWRLLSDWSDLFGA